MPDYCQGHCTKCWAVTETETWTEHCQTLKMKCFVKHNAGT